MTKGTRPQSEFRYFIALPQTSSVLVNIARALRVRPCPATPVNFRPTNRSSRNATSSEHPFAERRLPAVVAGFACVSEAEKKTSGCVKRNPEPNPSRPNNKRRQRNLEKCFFPVKYTPNLSILRVSYIKRVRLVSPRSRHPFELQRGNCVATDSAACSAPDESKPSRESRRLRRKRRSSSADRRPTTVLAPSVEPGRESRAKEDCVNLTFAETTRGLARVSRGKLGDAFNGNNRGLNSEP